jgi:hypothetical protein
MCFWRHQLFKFSAGKNGRKTAEVHGEAVFASLAALESEALLHRLWLRRTNLLQQLLHALRPYKGQSLLTSLTLHPIKAFRSFPSRARSLVLRRQEPLSTPLSNSPSQSISGLSQAESEPYHRSKIEAPPTQFPSAHCFMYMLFLTGT